MTSDQKDGLELLFASAIGFILLVVSLVIIDTVWGLQEPDYPTGTCRDAESLREIECGRYD